MPFFKLQNKSDQAIKETSFDLEELQKLIKRVYEKFYF